MLLPMPHISYSVLLPNQKGNSPSQIRTSYCREMSPQKDLRINVPVLNAHTQGHHSRLLLHKYPFPPSSTNVQLLHKDRFLKHIRLYSEYSLFMDHGLRTVKWFDYFVLYMAHALGNGIN